MTGERRPSWCECVGDLTYGLAVILAGVVGKAHDGERVCRLAEPEESISEIPAAAARRTVTADANSVAPGRGRDSCCVEPRCQWIARDWPHIPTGGARVSIGVSASCRSERPLRRASSGYAGTAYGYNCIPIINRARADIFAGHKRRHQRGRRGNDLSTFVVKSCIVLARYFLRVGPRAVFMGVWRHFHEGFNFWILTLFGSGYAGLG